MLRVSSDKEEIVESDVEVKVEVEMSSCMFVACIVKSVMHVDKNHMWS